MKVMLFNAKTYLVATACITYYKLASELRTTLKIKKLQNLRLQYHNSISATPTGDESNKPKIIEIGPAFLSS